MKILGVDPGVHGALAIVEMYENGPRLLAATDVPLTGAGAEERVDAIGLQQWLLAQAPDRAVIERAGSMPKQGVASTFKYGRAAGALEAVIAANAIPVEFVESSHWKRILRLRGKDKESARQLALQLFPAAHHLLQRKKDHQRAEAALIGLVGLRHSAILTSTPSPARHVEAAS